MTNVAAADADVSAKLTTRAHLLIFAALGRSLRYGTDWLYACEIRGVSIGGELNAEKEENARRKEKDRNGFTKGALKECSDHKKRISPSG